MSEFDEEAASYDAHFSDTCVGKEQRRQVYQALEKDGLFSNQRILELNCGTGIDAAEFLKRGNTVLATDASPGMLEEAKKRLPAENLRLLRLEEIRSLEEKFSLIFSNFGGVNCLSPEQMQTFLREAENCLTPGGSLVLVVMGKRTCWERFYLFLKGKRKEMNRRNTRLEIEVPVGNGTVATWYYSPKELMAMNSESFSVRSQKPIGLFVPPSYLAPFFERRKLSFRFLKMMDRLFRFPGCSNFSDHYYLHLRKK